MKYPERKRVLSGWEMNCGVMTASAWMALAPVLVALGAALAALLADAAATPRLASRVAACGLLAAATLSLLLNAEGATVGTSFTLGWSRSLFPVVFGVAALAVFSAARLERRPQGGQVAALVAFSAAGSALQLSSSDLAALVVTLELVALPDDLKAEIDTKLPPRWSRNNPVDLAAGETRDTIPELLDLITSHPAVDAVIYLGLGIQSNQARMMREGRFYPDHGLERIVAYHERQDARFAEAAADDRQEEDDDAEANSGQALTWPRSTTGGPRRRSPRSACAAPDPASPRRSGRRGGRSSTAGGWTGRRGSSASRPIRGRPSGSPTGHSSATRASGCRASSRSSG
jgi:hypothetical protein